MQKKKKKRQATQREKYLQTTYLTKDRPVTKQYKEFSKLDTKKLEKWIRKWQKIWTDIHWKVSIWKYVPYH